MADFWMKLHVDIIESRDFARLSDIAWRIYFEMSLLSKKTTNDGTLGSEEDIAWSLRRSVELIHAALTELEEAGFVSRTDSGWKIDDFESSQAATTATERSVRFRERARRMKPPQGKTEQEASCNATATECCTNCNETATEEKQQENGSATERETNCNATATERCTNCNETATERCTEKEIELRAESEKELIPESERELEGESERETEKTDDPAVLPRESRTSRDPTLNASAPVFGGQKNAEEPPPEARMVESAKSGATSGKNVDGSGKTQDWGHPNHEPPSPADCQQNKSTKTPEAAPTAARSAPKREYGEFQNVRLTDAELLRLIGRFPRDWTQRIERLGGWKKAKGKAMSSDYAAILNWARRDGDGGDTAGAEAFAAGIPKDSVMEAARKVRTLTTEEVTRLGALGSAERARTLRLVPAGEDLSFFLGAELSDYWRARLLTSVSDERLLGYLAGTIELSEEEFKTETER